MGVTFSACAPNAPIATPLAPNTAAHSFFPIVMVGGVGVWWNGANLSVHQIMHCAGHHRDTIF
jgi:hypothetical protein